MPQSRNQVSPKNSQRNDGFPNSAQVSEYWSLDELNKYSCQLEDKITEGQQYITALARLHQATSQQLAALQHAMRHYLVIAERHDLMEGILLDPNQLADWTLKMLDPQTGIYGSLQNQGQYQSRPSFPAMPAPGGGGQAGQAWNQLEWAMDQNPAIAWQIVDRMSPADFQSRPMFVPN
jgi:hypothetical protein